MHIITPLSIIKFIFSIKSVYYTFANCLIPNIVRLVNNIVQSVIEYGQVKDLSIIFHTNIIEKILACDPIMIERAMLNLISNAIKFSDPKNEEFCVNWANAQLAAGATAICYFDPLASPNMIERSTYLSTGHQIAKRTISRINGPVATHLASGITLPVIDDIVDTGSAVLGFSSDDDLEAVKEASRNKICLLGNINAVDMINWSSNRVEQEVKNIIKKAGQGGGLILSDNHGEIPWQVPEQVLLEISEAVQRFGHYPLEWVEKNE